MIDISLMGRRYHSSMRTWQIVCLAATLAFLLTSQAGLCNGDTASAAWVDSPKAFVEAFKNNSVSVIYLIANVALRPSDLPELMPSGRSDVRRLLLKRSLVVQSDIDRGGGTVYVLHLAYMEDILLLDGGVTLTFRVRPCCSSPACLPACLLVHPPAHPPACPNVHLSPLPVGLLTCWPACLQCLLA